MLNLKPELCTECQICMEICSFNHFGEGTTKRARIWVDGDWPKVPNMFVCLDCVDRECGDFRYRVDPSCPRPGRI